jgi:glycosyltransferase involved in cell wall biosynthesis
MAPAFSIIMTSYNHDRFVGATIESVLGQTLQDWELLIVDDCSPDDSWDVISRYQDPRIYREQFKQNRGASAAYNKAYSLAKGEYIASIDCDDVFHPEKLQRQKEFIDAHPEVDIHGTYVIEIDEYGQEVPTDASKYAPWFNMECDLNDPANWIGQNRLCHSSAIIRKSLHDQVGLFDEELIYTDDWNFWIRALIAGARFHVTDELLLKYRAHDDNITHKKPIETQREYAKFSGRIWHPYLERIDRGDLITKNIETTLQQLNTLRADANDITSLLNLLLPPTAFSTNGVEYHHNEAGYKAIAAVLVDLAAKAEYERLQAESTTQELEKAIKQCQVWEHTVHEIESAAKWNDEQRQAWEHTAHELESAIQWNDEQRQAWERTAHELESTVQWNNEQRQAWERTARELQEVIELQEKKKRSKLNISSIGRLMKEGLKRTGIFFRRPSSL